MAGKRVGSSHDWSWHCFSLVEKVARVLLTNHRALLSQTKANVIYFCTLYWKTALSWLASTNKLALSILFASQLSNELFHPFQFQSSIRLWLCLIASVEQGVSKFWTLNWTAWLEWKLLSGSFLSSGVRISFKSDFFPYFFSQMLKLRTNCEDLSWFNLSSAVQIDVSYIHIHSFL